VALEKARHKLQSSLANFVFVNIDLPPVWKTLNWEMFNISSRSIIKEKKDLEERLEAMRLSVLTYHIEIMKQSLYEQIELLNCDDNKDLKALKYFLLDLRNAFGHTTGKLIPQYSNNKPLHTNKTLNKNTFEVDIPVENETTAEFDPSSNFSMKFTWKGIKPNKEVKVNDPFIHKILILSYHVLEITKKQKKSTLNSYLNKIPKAMVLAM